MTKSTPKTTPKQIADDCLETVQGGLIGLLRTPETTDGTSNALSKTGTGTLVLGNSNTY